MNKDVKEIKDIKDIKDIEELEKNKTVKKIFREIYTDDFDDPCEDFVDSLYDVVPEEEIVNELKKIKGIKIKHGKIYSVEKVKR